MAKVDLTLGETRTKADLTLEDKNAGITWDAATWTWNDATSTWDDAKGSLSLETRSKADLSLETK